MSTRAKGRPSKLTLEIQATICRAVRAGNYIETAAAAAGISKDTLYRWLRMGAAKAGLHRAFSDALKKASAETEIDDLTVIREAARTDWKAAAWLLERKHPGKFSRTVNVHPVSSPPVSLMGGAD